MKKKILLTASSVLLILSGCAQKKVINPNGGNPSILGLNQHGQTGRVIGNGGTTTYGNGYGDGSDVSGYQNVDPYGNGTGGYGNDTYGQYNQNNSYGEGGSGIKNVYFDVDQYNITSDKVGIISQNANLLKSDISHGAKVKIEGHCDASGSDEYNYALGLRRAKSAKDAMIQKGIPSNSISLVSMGESSPECISDTSSSCYSQNRRVEFKIVE